MHQTHLTRHTFPKMANLYIPISPCNLLISTFSWLYVHQDDQIKCSYLTRWYILYVFFLDQNFCFYFSYKELFTNVMSKQHWISKLIMWTSGKKNRRQASKDYKIMTAIYSVISYNHWQFIFIIKLEFFLFVWTRVY